MPDQVRHDEVTRVSASTGSTLGRDRDHRLQQGSRTGQSPAAYRLLPTGRRCDLRRHLAGDAPPVGHPRQEAARA